MPPQPACKPLVGMTRHEIHVDGNRFTVFEHGEGPAVLLLHGFPSSSADWRHLIPALAERGFRCVAPDLLGLGDSDMPDDVAQYTVAKDAEHALRIADELGLDRFHLVCHDRGATHGWLIAADRPERVDRLVAFSLGHPNALLNPSIEQRELTWYMLLAQFDVADEAFSRDDWRLFRAWFRNHPELDTWISDLSRPGALHAALHWYRANRNPDRPAGGPTREPIPHVAAPALGIWATDDCCLLPEQMLDSWQFMDGPWSTVRLDGASHFMMLDQVERTNRLVASFLTGDVTGS
jgi:pimeloyl-ACP methyl ester carboxylesterase